MERKKAFAIGLSAILLISSFIGVFGLDKINDTSIEPIEPIIEKPVDFTDRDKLLIEETKETAEILYDKLVVPKVSVFGTDYFKGERNVTTFLQLLDEDRQPLTNSTCFASIWYPDKTKLFNNTLMSYLDEGLYYLDYNLPSQAGVYMVSAYCSIPKLELSLEYLPNYTAETFETGSFSGGTNWVGSWVYGTGSTVQTSDVYNGTYALEQNENGLAFREFDLTNGINITVSFWAKFDSIDLNEYAYFSVYDGTEYVIATWQDGDDDDTWRYYQYDITSFNPTCTALFILRNNFNSVHDKAFFDDIKITYYRNSYSETNGTEYQFVRGSGEVHIIDNANLTYSTFPAFTRNYFNSSCMGNGTLRKEYVSEYCYDTYCFNQTRSEFETCEFGCLNGKCAGRIGWYWIIGIIFVLFVAHFILKRMGYMI